jgi:malonate-semialdehyde dehydrogenase (acetylating) / methylmalonate-semialdehyde dehydrogenase
MHELTHFIGGRHVKSASGRFVEGFEPMTGRAISRVPLASKEEARAAVANASAAQPAWAATNPQRRARV